MRTTVGASGILTIQTIYLFLKVFIKKIVYELVLCICHSHCLFVYKNFHILSYITGYKDDAELHFLNIYFASPTFDKVINDEKANFETKLSAIGGTIGLFAGVSILSAVEILYFIVKIFLSNVLPSK